MKAKTFAKFLNNFNYYGFIIICLLFFFSTILQPVSGASSSGNTTIYDYSTNSTLTNGGNVEFACNATGASATLTIDIDPYAGTNELEPIIAYYRGANGSAIEENISDTGYENRTRIVVGTNQSHFYNMTWIDSSKSWRILISNNESIDLTLYFMANSQSYLCLNTTATIKIRPAFYYTLHFYQGSNMTEGTDVRPYKNDFQYVYMRINNASSSWTDTTIFKDMSYVDRMVSWVPFYKPSFSVKADNTLTFWSRYSDGEARIKLYEAPQNYSIHIMTDDTYGLTWTDEFTRPQLQDYSWNSVVINSLRVTESTSKTIGLYLSKWEINKFLFLMNLGYWALIFIAWGIMMMFLIRTGGIGVAIGFTIGWFVFAKIVGLAIL